MPSIIAFSPVSHAFSFLLGIFYAPVSYALQIKEIPLDQNNFLVENSTYAHHMPVVCWGSDVKINSEWLGFHLCKNQYVETK